MQKIGKQGGRTYDKVSCVTLSIDTSLDKYKSASLSTTMTIALGYWLKLSNVFRATRPDALRKGFADSAISGGARPGIWIPSQQTLFLFWSCAIWLRRSKYRSFIMWGCLLTGPLVSGSLPPRKATHLAFGIVSITDCLKMTLNPIISITDCLTATLNPIKGRIKSYMLTDIKRSTFWVLRPSHLELVSTSYFNIFMGQSFSSHDFRRIKRQDLGLFLLSSVAKRKQPIHLASSKYAPLFPRK